MKRTLLILAIVVLAQPVIPAQQGAVATAPSPAAAVDEDLREVDIFHAGMRRWCRGRRQAGADEGLRHGRSRARCPQHAGHDLRSGIGVEAVHRDGRAAARRRRQAVARRSGPQVHPRAARLRQAADDSPHADRTPAACATGAASSPLPAGRGRRANTRMRTCSTSCRGRSRSTSIRARIGPTATRASTSRRSSCRVSAACRSPSSRSSASSRPLGLTHTSWRDDHTRIVKGRAIAYSLDGGEYHTEMPFENVHGNGGLLTTVGDLLMWNENLVNAEGRQREADLRDGDRRPVQRRETAGLRSRPVHRDAPRRAQRVSQRIDRRVPRSSQSFPDSSTSVAVLCNGSNGDASRAANRVSDVFLGDRLKPAAPADPRAAPPAAMNPPPSAAQSNALAGSYWSDEAETMLIAAVDQGALVLRRRPDTVIKLTAIGPDKFRGSIGTVTFIRNASGAVDALSVNQDRVWDLRFAKK